MGELIQFKTKIPTVYCNHCGEKIGEGYTYGLAFYCDTCQANLIRNNKTH